MSSLAANKQRTSYRAGTVATHLRYFIGWAGEYKTAADVDEAAVQGYYTHALTDTGADHEAGPLGHIQAVRAAWLAEQRHCQAL
ncbi:MAG: hypothetical protein R3C45_01875 [Phycisphaerales bacterium]